MRDRTGQIWLIRPSLAPADDWLFIVTNPATRKGRCEEHPVLYAKHDNQTGKLFMTETIGSDTQWEENDSYTRIA